MNFNGLYRASFYLMLVFATLVLSIDATDSKLSMFYPCAVGVAGAAAMLIVDRRPGAGVSPSFGGVLALGATILTLIEFLLDRNLLLLALGHWLVYLQIIYMFRVKSVETDWWMFCLGLVQVMVGSVMSQSDKVGLMLFCWAVLALWVLGLFSLRRDADRAQAASIAGSDPTSAGAVEPYPGLFDPPFLFSAARVTITTLALGGVIFLAMPRRPGMARSFRGQGQAQHLTGFDEEVQLGQMGEVLENDSIVMSIELFDEHDERIVPTADMEYLWRGATMERYERGRWRRPDRRTSRFALFQTGPVGMFNPRAASSGVVRQQVRLEANDSNVLFGLRPIFDASSRRLSPELNPIDGTLFRIDSRPGTYEYEVRSFSDPKLPQPHEAPPSPYRKVLLLEVPDALRDRLRSIAEGAIAEYRKTRAIAPDEILDDRTRARALEWYLRDSGAFGYTLTLDVVDPDLDPVIDFLVNRKEGHCEYFASALALLLRSVGIPSRMVNGFKGGDWNGLARMLNVRQKHAHSWVEAHLGDRVVPVDSKTDQETSFESGGERRRPEWIVLDPTPGNERDQAVASVGGFKGNFRQITDLVRYVWLFYVVGYDADRQNRLVYGPVRMLAREARRGFALMSEQIQAAWIRLKQWLHFPTTRSFFSARGFLVSFVGLCLVYGLFWLLQRLVWRLWGRFMGDGPDAAALEPGAAQYRRLAAMLAEYGLERPPSETQDEFAHRASVFLAGRGTNTAPVTEVPRLVVDAFYRVRFGHRALDPPAVSQLETGLDALEQSLRAGLA